MTLHTMKSVTLKQKTNLRGRLQTHGNRAPKISKKSSTALAKISKSGEITVPE